MCCGLSRHIEESVKSVFIKGKSVVESLIRSAYNKILKSSERNKGDSIGVHYKEFMKKIRMFKAQWCPHCQNAKGWLNELLAEEPKYQALEIEQIDIDTEQDKMKDVDFYYVPTFYVENDKAFEGVPSKEIIQKVLDSAM